MSRAELLQLLNITWNVQQLDNYSFIVIDAGLIDLYIQIQKNIAAA